jgi:hypothetical protein
MTNPGDDMLWFIWRRKRVVEILIPCAAFHRTSVFFNGYDELVKLIAGFLGSDLNGWKWG